MMSCGAKWPKSRGLNGQYKIAGQTVQNIKFAVGLSLSVASRSVLSVGSKVCIGDLDSMPGLHKHAHMKPVPMVQVLVNTKHVTAHWPTRKGLLLKHHPYCRPMVSLRHVLTAFYMLWDCGHLAPATGPFCPDPWVKWPT